jgi:hypothetical protein
MSSEEATAVREARRRHTVTEVGAFLAGGLAAPLVTLPLDVLRTRVQGASRRVLRVVRTHACVCMWCPQAAGSLARWWRGLPPLLLLLLPLLLLLLRARFAHCLR